MSQLSSAPYHFTLHIRLTHACNASCTYCSSWQKDPDERMKPDSFSACLDGVEHFWKLANINPSFLNIEYVGGEILLVPETELRSMVLMARERFGKTMTVRDGAQSNLIGSQRKIDALSQLFDGRIGTSVDHFTNQRQLGSKGSPAQKAGRYRTFFMTSSINERSKSGKTHPAVLTLDNQTLEYLNDEITIAIEEGRDLTIRPVFQGGSVIGGITPEALGEALVKGFAHWNGRGMRTRVEPFVSLLRRRLNSESRSPFCAWQRDCAVRSLSIEPNGDLYVCQELADMSSYRLGNLIRKEFDHALHNRLASRESMLEKGCFECPYFSSCQGGCMQQSVEAGTGMYGKTQWCKAWKMLFKVMDDLIETTGQSRLLARLNALHSEV